MITSEKLFGSYRLKKVVLDDTNESSTETCILPSEWQPLTLIERRAYNHDTSIFRFKLLNDSDHLNLAVGCYLLVRAPCCDHDGSDAIRPYTAVSNNNTSIGYFDILCKRYDEWGVKETASSNFLFTKTDHSYKPKGACSNYIHSLKIGDSLEFKR